MEKKKGCGFVSVCFILSIGIFFGLNAGNKNGESAPVVITIDATGPEIHFTSVPASFKNRDKSVTYTGTASDSVTGISSARYSTDGGETWEDLELAEDGIFTITIEVTDVDGNINCYNTRIHAGESTPQAEPVKAPDYTVFDISGKVNGMDSVSVTVSGTRYMLADFSRIEAGITENTRVTGKGRAYTKENVLVVETLQAVKETLTPFSGLVDDLGFDYVIIDGYAMAIDSETQRYCEDIRTGDYVSGLYRTENGTMIAAEFGPLSCDRNEITRTDTGIVGN